MKKVLVIVLCLMMCISLMPSFAFAEEGSIELSDEYYTEEQGSITQLGKTAEVNRPGAIASADDGETELAAGVRTVSASRHVGLGDTAGRFLSRSSDQNQGITEAPSSVLKGALRGSKAGEDTRRTDEEGTYLFTDFAELKALTEYDYPEHAVALYDGVENLIVTEELVIPSNLDVYMFDYDEEDPVFFPSLIIPAGVTVSISAEAMLVVYDLEVNGALINEGYFFSGFNFTNGAVTLMAYLEVNGTIENSGEMEFPYSLSGLENINNSGNGYTAIKYPIGNEDEFATMVDIATADSDVHHEYDAYAIRNLTISGTYYLPARVSFYIQLAEVTITGNGLMRVGYSDYGMSWICLHNYGTLRVKGVLVNDSLIEIYSTASLICDRSTGIYGGTGRLGVQDTGEDIFSVYVNNLDENRFDTYIYYNTEKKLYGLELKAEPYYLNKAEISLEAGKTETLELRETATGLDASADKWSSSDETVATVSDNGAVTAKKAGTAAITASCEDTSATCEVLVQFTDVTDSTRSFYAPVYWALKNGITTGTSKTTFSPNNSCTRAQIVTFLWRLKGCPEPESMESPFTDVTNPKASYYKPVLWALENGITTGTSKTTFSPDKACTRAQCVTFLWRALGCPEPKSMESPFTDVTNPKASYYKPVLWALENGITTGTSKTTFSPNNTCTRGQIVTFLYRYNNL